MSDDNIDWHERNFLYIIALGDGERVVKELQSDKNLVYGNDIITYQDYLSRMYRKYLKGTELVTSLLAWECSDEGWDGLHNLCRTHDVVDVLTCLYQIYQGNIGKVMPIIEHNVIPAPEHRNIKTVGLYVYAYGGGGAERVVSLLIPRFTSIGYRVILITQIQNELNEYSLLNDVQRITLSNQMKDEPEKYFRQWQDIFSSYHLDALCLHLPYEGEVFFFTALLAKLCGLRVIGENHTSCINFVRQRGGLRGHDRMYRILDGLVVLSRMDELFWSVFGCRTRYIPNPCPALPSSNSCHSKKNGRTIIWIGRRNQKYKRICDTVLIMREVLKKIPDAKLLIVGDKVNDADDARFFSLLQREKIESHIEICGWQKDVGSFYSFADVMLFTSPGEGFPMVVAEAMQHALPIVMYDLPYLELVRSGRGVISVKQGDICGAAEALTKVLCDEDVRKRLSLEALENIREFEHWNIDELWKDMLENGGGQNMNQDTGLMPTLLRELCDWENN
ncbi:glycosyltransferase [Selenomonas ruminantium]|uniref:glycosyltransferase n=1 Tax=Selenomonas ruminantium TaxID=971 RepID=UPI0018AF9C7B|nr:glycosyltransferase [Selenomonas ruminantium]